MRIEFQVYQMMEGEPAKVQLLMSGTPGDSKQPIDSIYFATDIQVKAARRLHEQLGRVIKRAEAKTVKAAEQRKNGKH